MQALTDEHVRVEDHVREVTEKAAKFTQSLDGYGIDEIRQQIQCVKPSFFLLSVFHLAIE